MSPDDFRRIRIENGMAMADAFMRRNSRTYPVALDETEFAGLLAIVWGLGYEAGATPEPGPDGLPRAPDARCWWKVRVRSGFDRCGNAPIEAHHGIVCGCHGLPAGGVTLNALRELANIGYLWP